MFRTLFISSKRLLKPRFMKELGLPPEEHPPTTTPVFDVRRSQNREYRQLLHPTAYIHPHALATVESLRWSSQGAFQVPNPTELACNMINMLKCVDLNDMKDAYPQSFWTAIGIASIQLGAPFLELVGGYSPTLTFLQLYTAAATLIFNGGTMWGLALSKDPVPAPSWETMTWSFAPTGIAVTGLLLPYPLGFVTMAIGMIVSLYIKLKSCLFPPWACALALFKTVMTVVGLFLALSAYVLFHNREKKLKSKDDEVPPEGEYIEDGDKEK